LHGLKRFMREMPQLGVLCYAESVINARKHSRSRARCIEPSGKTAKYSGSRRTIVIK